MAVWVARRRIQQPVDTGPPVDDQPPAHAEMQPDDHVRPRHLGGGVEQQQLAAPSGADQLAADERGLGAGRHQAPLEIPGVRCVYRGDGTVKRRTLRQLAVPLDLGQFGHQGDRPASWQARANTASSMGSVSFPVKVFCWLG